MVFNKPYSSQIKFRKALAIGILSVGLLCVTSPAWVSKGLFTDVFVAAMVSLGGALIGYGIGSIVTEFHNPAISAISEVFEEQNDSSTPGFARTVRLEVLRALEDANAETTHFAHRQRLMNMLDLGNAQESIHIQGISLSQKWQTTPLLERVLQNNPSAEIRILLMHPYSRHGLSRDEDLGFDQGMVRKLVEETLSALQSLVHKGNIEVRGYWTLPYYGTAIVDRTKAVLNLSREGRGGDQNLGAFVSGATPTTEAMVLDLVSGFEYRWEQSANLMSPFDVDLIEDPTGASEGEFLVLIQAPCPLDLDSLTYEVTNAEVTPLQNLNRTQIQLRVFRTAPGQIRIRLLEALSADRNRWLARPKETTVLGVL